MADVEIIDEDRVYGVTGVLGPVLDGHRSMPGKFPHGFCVAGDERRRDAEQLSYQASAAG